VRKNQQPLENLDDRLTETEGAVKKLNTTADAFKKDL
jgi:hypothetical protein